MLTERAPAKINLTLRIVGRRDDGYHLLDSLVGFARDAFDDVSFTPGAALSLLVDGPTAEAAGDPEHNLILKAARVLMERREGVRPGAFHLIKRLPVAGGVGGGSADAAAALRLMARASDIPLDDPMLFEAARATGADVPVCLTSRLRMMAGIGDELGPALESPALPALLVNPRVPCPTGPVFRELGVSASRIVHDQANLPSPQGGGKLVATTEFIDWLSSRPNDLEAPAIRLVPVIADVLESLRALEGCALARMSGSGATCFALFDNRDALTHAEQQMRRHHADWWIAPTMIV